MNVAEVDLLTPPARETAPAAADTAPAEPFDRVLARRAEQDRNPDHDRKGDTSPADTAGGSATREVHHADAPRPNADAEATDDVAPERDDPSTDPADGAPVAAAGGAAATTKADTPAGSATSGTGNAPPTAAKASGGEGTAAGAAAKAPASTSAQSAGSTPAPQATPPTGAAESAPDGKAAPAASMGSAQAAAPVPPADPDRDTPADAKADAKVETKKSEAHMKAQIHLSDDGADAPPAPDAAQKGLAKAAQQAAAAAQPALAKAVEAATQGGTERGADGSTSDRGHAIAPPSGSADGTAQDAGKVQAARSEAARHAASFDQVIDRTLRMLRVGAREANVRLVPEHLGEVRVRITVDRGTVTADLTCHTAVARELMAHHQDRLQQALLDGGADGARVNVSMGDGGQAWTTRDERPASHALTGVPIDPTPEATTAAVERSTLEATARGGVSIRA